MKKICVITGSRAEYGILYPLIKKLHKDCFFELKIVVTGSHLSENFGLTYQDILADGFCIDEKIDILSCEDTPHATTTAMGKAMIQFGEYFSKNKPDITLVLGDRYEIFSAVSTCAVLQIPVAHLHGGELTMGAYDDCFRHSITKMSNLHFTATQVYRDRVISLGEQPNTVFHVGSLAVETIKNTTLLTKNQLEERLDFSLTKPFGLVTFHPVTLEKTDVKEQFSQLLQALSELDSMQFILTKSNADSGGLEINRMIDAYASLHKDRMKAVASLGQLGYHSAMKHTACVIGNSSSGIIEAPIFRKPTVNIGNRQAGRMMPQSVICCNAIQSEIVHSVKKATSITFGEKIAHQSNPFGTGNSSDLIIKELKLFLENPQITTMKHFYE